MEISEEKYFKERLEDQINWYDKKSGLNQQVYKWFKRGEILVAALIPLIAGIATKDEVWAFVVGAMGSLIAIIEGILSIGKYHENWIDYRSICETLRHEKFMFLTKTGVYNNDSPFILLVERIESIISNENVNWANLNSNIQGEKTK